jgi:UDP-N-acetylmuramoyl-tripeptide--D-alanyl-D-alanine ligase
MTLGDAILATGGILLRGEASQTIGSISTNSRDLRLGDFFIPLVGKKFDGNEFLAEAIRKGASGCLVSSRWSGKARMLRQNSGSTSFIEVPDTNAAYANIAGYYRNLFPELSLVAVTGSNGKSTTKEMIAAVLASRYPILKNEGTLNNVVGVSRSLLQLRREMRIAVLELGTSVPGEIDALVSIARPDVGVLTNIGPSHLEFFKSLEGVAKEKGMLAERLDAEGVLVVNADDPLAWAIRRRTQGKVLSFGFGLQADVRASEASCDRQGHWSFRVELSKTKESETLTLSMLGKHNIANALGAMAVGSHYGLSLKDMKPILQSHRGLSMRLESYQIGGIRIINDAYNSNPQSFARAVETLTETTCSGRRIIVMGDMLELGPEETQAHIEAGRKAATVPASVFIAVGSRARQAADAYADGIGKKHKGASRAFRYADVAGASAFLRDFVRPGDLVLLKGSRGMHLEKLLDRLLYETDGMAGVAAVGER